MSLKTDLNRDIRKQILFYNLKLEGAEHSLESLTKTNMQNTNYNVRLDSCWEMDGEESTNTKYTGTLKDAIKKAEEGFMEINNRNDISASYHVSICFGNGSYSVAEKYWKRFRKNE